MLFLTLFSLAQAQTAPIFTKKSSQPVLNATEDWEEKSIGAISVLYDAGLFKAWYFAGMQLGYATSPDGVTWTKYAKNPLNLSASFKVDNKGQGFNGQAMDYSSVVKMGSQYFLYYRETDHRRDMIGWATSNDGVSWMKSSTPVLSGTFPDVIYANGQFSMWYSVDSNQGIIEYAVSSDGKAWNMVQQIHLPPLPVGYRRAASTGAAFAGGVYHMWYTVESSSSSRLAYATSTDGINWAGNEDNPIQGETSARNPSVVIGPSTSYLWYIGDRDAVYLATTSMLIGESTLTATSTRESSMATTVQTQSSTVSATQLDNALLVVGVGIVIVAVAVLAVKVRGAKRARTSLQEGRDVSTTALGEQETKHEKSNYVFCAACGAKLPIDAAFCGVCGKQLPKP